VKTQTLRDRARHRLKRPEDIDPAEWARMVEEAYKQGFELFRFPGLIVKFRLIPDDGDARGPHTDGDGACTSHETAGRVVDREV
jgi:hypothetical protein